MRVMPLPVFTCCCFPAVRIGFYLRSIPKRQPEVSARFGFSPELHRSTFFLCVHTISPVRMRSYATAPAEHQYYAQVPLCSIYAHRGPTSARGLPLVRIVVADSA